uniref:Uncharacterized protein n=1 Tax=uncultured marine virus TaxID=186617 RepID=A0A0F7L4U0_9VIRU|nr:hypothetical protein [uncultured marine virus]
MIWFDNISSTTVQFSVIYPNTKYVCIVSINTHSFFTSSFLVLDIFFDFSWIFVCFWCFNSSAK